MLSYLVWPSWVYQILQRQDRQLQEISRLNAEVTALADLVKDTSSHVDSLIGYAAALEARLERMALQVGPLPPTIRILGEEFDHGNPMKQYIKFEVTLPPPSARDVTGRELSVTDGDGSTLTAVTVLPSATVSEPLRVLENTSITVSLVDIDNAGNRSPASSVSLIVQDTIAPPQPGTLGVHVIGEEFEEEEPPVEDPETPETPESESEVEGGDDPEDTEDIPVEEPESR